MNNDSEIPSAIYTAAIAALASDGAGIGPIIGPVGPLVGKKVLIPGSIPGENIDFTLSAEEQSTGLASGKLVKITNPHPQRRTPPCKYVPTCGGCSVQHMQIGTQRSEKLKMVQSLLLRQAKLEPTTGFSIIGAELPEFEYRNRILLHLDLTGQLGFYRTNTGDVVDIEHCMLAEPRINALVTALRPFTKELAPRVAAIKIERRESGFFILLKPRIRNGELNREIVVLSQLPATILHDQHKDSAANMAVGHFSQVNSAANEVLVSYVVEQFKLTAPLQQRSRITEFYSGAGNFTFPLITAGHSVTAIELDEQLVKAAEGRAAELGVSSHLKQVSKSCEKYCSDLKQATLSKLVLLDPPRAGAKIVAETISSKDTEKIVYVSCNPATLARDLKILVENNFVLSHVAVLDMFSQTAHVETVSVLVRAAV